MNISLHEFCQSKDYKKVKRFVKHIFGSITCFQILMLSTYVLLISYTPFGF